MTIINQRYELFEKLGEGGMAEVYRAVQLNLDREVAIKFIKSSIPVASFAERFQREARTIARLNHPNIIQVYDFDKTEDDRYFMAMELLRSDDLATHLRGMKARGVSFPLESTLHVVRSAAEALAYAHEHQVVHRDVKPHNIFLVERNRVVVADFGIARIVSEGGLTQTGMVIGTPYYFAPEQGGGQVVDYRVDIYALGVVFYELLTGRVPFDANSTLAILAQHATAPIPDPREIRPDLPAGITDIIQTAMAKKTDSRYPHMDAFITALDAVARESGVGGGTTIHLDSDSVAQPVEDHETILGSPSETADTDAQSLQAKTTLQKPGSHLRTWQYLTGLITIIVIIAGGLWAIAGQNKANRTDKTDNAIEKLAASIPPAAEGEHLILVADFEGETAAGLDISNRVANVLRSGDLAGLMENFRLEEVDTVISSREEAEQLAELTGAMFIVRGHYDAAGLEIVMQAPHYPDETLKELSFLIPAGENFSTQIIEQMPPTLSLYTIMLSLQQLLREDNLEAMLLLNIYLSEEVKETDIQVIPGSALDEYILDAATALATGDGETADEVITHALNLEPQDPTLYFLRFSVNGFYLSRPERALEDTNRLEELIPDSNVVVWAKGAMYMVQEDYESLATLKSPAENSNADALLTMVLYRALAWVSLGEFEAAYAEVEHVDTEQMAELLGLHIVEFTRALYYEITGNAEAATADYRVIRSSRLLEQSSSVMVTPYLQNPPTAVIIFGGYVSEINGDTGIATLAYQMALINHPDDYLLNWRRAILYEQAGDYQSAYDSYQRAVDNAPVPFPIASYQLAQLIHEYGDSLDSPIDACTALDTALSAASDDMYAILQQKIAASQDDFGCTEISVSEPTPVPEVAVVEIDITPAAEEEYLYIVTDFVGDDEAGMDVARRVLSFMQTGELVAILGDDFRVEHTSQAVASSEEATALAESTGALMIIWGIYDAAGLEIVMQVPEYPTGTLREAHLLIPQGDNFVSAITDELPDLISAYARTLTTQKIMGEDNFAAMGRMMTESVQLDIPEGDLTIVPLTMLDKTLLEIFRTDDPEQLDDLFSDVLEIAPDDPGMYFNRWTINAIELQHSERAWSDAYRIEELLQGNYISFWVTGTMAMIEGDYEKLANLSGYSSEDDLSVLLDFYKAIGQMMLGDFDAAFITIESMDSDLATAMLGYPARESLSAVAYEATGNDEFAVTARETIRASRYLENTTGIFTSFTPTQLPSALILYAGYISEVNNDTGLAALVYQQGLIAYPDNFLLNWRRGILYEQAESYAEAFAAYTHAAENAPQPFPVAHYERARLLHEQADSIESSDEVCDILQTTQSEAETLPELYAPLLAKIATLQTEAGCP